MRKRILLEYPQWHDNPLRLTAWQIRYPEKVLEDFFTSYTLTDARACLKEWLNDALAAEDTNASDIVTLYDDIERLVEAAWLYYQKGIESEMDAEEDESIEVESGDMTGDESAETNRFHKPPLLIDIAAKQPIRCLARVFEIQPAGEISQVLQNWLENAVSTNQNKYQSASQRADLFVFCRKFNLLMQALSRLNDIYRIGEADSRLSDRELNKYNRLLQPSGVEQANPFVAVEDFWNRFRLRYVKAELWDMLQSAVSYEGTRKKFDDIKSLLSFYECMVCLATSSYVLHNIRVTPTS